MYKVKDFIVKLLKSPLLLFVFVGLYPVVFLVSKNWFVYDTKQLLFLLVVPVVTGLIGAVVLGLFFLKKLIIKKFPLKAKEFVNKWLVTFGIWRIAFSLFGFYILYILFEASFSTTKMLVFFIVGAVLISLFIRKIGFYYANIFFLILTLIAAGELIYSVNTRSIKSDYLVDSIDKNKDSKIKFTKKPNIYLIHLESYQSPEAMKRIYSIDNQAFVNDLSSMGFFVSQNNFSNYNATLSAIGALFLQQHHLYKLNSGTEDAIGIRDMIGGRLYNPALFTLKNNGYKIVYLHSDSYNFMGSDYLDYYYPKNSIHDSLMIFQSEKIKKIRAAVFNLERSDRKYLEAADANEFEKILWNKIETLSSESQPVFYYIKHYGVIHTPDDTGYSWKNSDEGWVGEYTQLVKDATPKIEEMVSKIVNIDPKGIIILYGDHGAWRYRNIWVGAKDAEDLNEQLKDRRNINGEDLAYDLFGTFMAVRNPTGDNEFLDKETHVNVFRELFFELSGNKSLLEDKVANRSYLRVTGRLYMLVKDSLPLKVIVARKT